MPIKTTVQEAGNLLRQSSESIDSSKPVILEDLPVGKAFAQGDVAILALDKLPSGAQKIDMPSSGQVAPGNTKGSRHCIAQPDHMHVDLYRVSDSDNLSDLCIVAKKPWTLEHPEHAHVTCPPGVYRFLHQQNEQRERVRD